jgi:hypothetical protein
MFKIARADAAGRAMLCFEVGGVDQRAEQATLRQAILEHAERSQHARHDLLLVELELAVARRAVVLAVKIQVVGQVAVAQPDALKPPLCMSVWLAIS